MSKEYVEQRDGGYWIAVKRISLASVVSAFRDGAAPESILRSFPFAHARRDLRRDYFLPIASGKN